MNKPVGHLTAKDFASDQEVRWCPGCGDYAILKCMQRTLPELGATPANTVFVSGIGCSSRFPYYMATYGFHTIHGRAPAVATGVKLANPDLDVWLITGDGDGLSIGGNHLMHTLRRNVDLNILLFNNEIYGLTKGQYSPTSRAGTRSPSTPYGSLDRPLDPAAFALGSGARFVARTIDTAQKHMPEIFKRAHAHKGASFVEIFQNCIVYNDGVFNDFTEKSVLADRTLNVRHGEPMIFGKNRDKGLVFDQKTFKLKVATIGEDGISESDILVHDETNSTLAHLLATLSPPDFPMVIGVIYCAPSSSYERDMTAQMEAVKAEHGAPDINAYLRRGYTWTVE
ncbi:2-oxoglutarate ferredoxin oxidoreductase subunit beta [Iodidimonas muriae]|uniref:2-oxoglutarate ferredoxin oxidoreductase subunit beta n=1 Tax=Iodidimonas muriae TaxID=261467 RepID=A0ABQ2LA66_9PROT|nr:2-oxoacid:ferredoxin oxidoreductase subunit beta [Iodidimonas muriae]GER06100.1 2-oxoglutarate ferredoxin oxidoreductase subunit beta [Kordiimonadales bacterium JCM 17843]GGO08207.1 2-oxoglutarate ferredoxin oxidoreductase subunit beta [Iodidimonas muriae]